MGTRVSRREQLRRVEDYLEKCYLRESSPRVSELARLLGVSRSNLVETFRRVAGTTLSQYLKDRQVAAARLLLSNTSLSVTQVGYRVGFGTRRTFFREFRKRTGMTPGQHRAATKCP